MSLHALSPELFKSLIVGAISLEDKSSGFTPVRLDVADRAFINEGLWSSAHRPSGVRVRCKTNATSFRLELTMESNTEPMWDGDNVVDVFIDEELKASFNCKGTDQTPTRFAVALGDLADGEKILDIYFPATTRVLLHHLSLNEGAFAEAAPARSRWLTHGSSITNGAQAASGGFTWPAIVARKKNWDLLNLGYGGQCKMEQVVARLIARTPADRISLCLGINTAGGEYSQRVWASTAEGFIMTVRDGHPETPLLIISPILSPPREKVADEGDLMKSLTTMREALKASVDKFRAAGDANIHYFDGRNIIGPGDEDYMPDELHPDADGIKLMGARFLEHAPSVWG
ncbi:MAG: SGNH/GDSL hydrolase family protein [Chthoniobacterales bacterium]